MVHHQPNRAHRNTIRHTLSNPSPGRPPGPGHTVRGIFLPAILLAFGLTLPASSADKKAPPPAVSPAEAEAAYTQNIEKRVGDILATLQFNDSARSARVHDLLIAQYRALRDWHDANDPKLRGATPEEASKTKGSLRTLHDRFLAGLGSELTADQVEKVKDKMTYGKVKVTYDAYCEIVPNLTQPQKDKIRAMLKEAREEAMDGGSAEEKSAVFKKYKGKINNYLSSEGHNVSQAYKDWGAKQKTKSAVPTDKAGK